MNTWPATKKCSHCRETGRPSHCAMCVARNIIDDLERQLVEAQERGKQAWRWAMFLRQFNNLAIVRERDEAQGKLDAVEPYVRHDRWCPHGEEEYTSPCNCGLAQIRNPKEGE